MEFDLKLISELLEALALAVIPVLGYMLSAYLRKQVDMAILKLNESERTSLLSVVKVGVYAAEQIFGRGFGTEKKEYVIGVVQEWADSSGIKVDISLIEAAIEEAVYKNFPKYEDIDELFEVDE